MMIIWAEYLFAAANRCSGRYFIFSSFSVCIVRSIPIGPVDTVRNQYKKKKGRMFVKDFSLCFTMCYIRLQVVSGIKIVHPTSSLLVKMKMCIRIAA